MSEDVNQNDITWIKEALIRIEKQTTKTNGRVDGLELWRAGVIGRVTGVSMAVSAIVALVFALLKIAV